VQPSYAVINSGVSGPVTNVGGPVAIPSAWLAGTSTGLAVGIISTSAGAAPEFPATWDLIEVTPGGGGGGGTSVASDTFTRSLTASWGTADVGGAWSVLAGTASNFAVNGSKGTILTPTKSVQQLAHLGSTSSRDVDARVDITVPPTVAKGSKGLFSSLVLRHQAGGADYRVGIYLPGTGKVFLRGQTNTGTSLFADVDTGLVFTPGDTLVLRVQALGASPTTIRAKVWKAGATEPSAWAVTATNTTAGLQTAGTVGIRTLNATSSAATLSFDNLRADRLSGA
jgi:hypothetical protein